MLDFEIKKTNHNKNFIPVNKAVQHIVSSSSYNTICCDFVFLILKKEALL